MRKRRRNGHHPILAAIGTMIVESAASTVAHLIVKPAANAPLGAAPYAVALVVPTAGYFVGKHFFPAYKTPILVGSILSMLFQGAGAAMASGLANVAKTKAIGTGSTVTLRVPVGMSVDVNGQPAGTQYHVDQLSPPNAYGVATLLLSTPSKPGSTWTNAPADATAV